MECLHSVHIEADGCAKEISVYCGDATEFDYEIDILTISAYEKSYFPTPRTILNALSYKGISVSKLASSPEIDLREPCHIWLSNQIFSERCKIGRVGCIELLGGHLSGLSYMDVEQSMINSICAYFLMLDMAYINGVKIETIALPLIGSGAQHIIPELILIPLINECVSFLKRNVGVKKICFIEKNCNKAEMIASYLKNSLKFISVDCNFDKSNKITQLKSVFLSYATEDKNIADNLCSKLERNGVRVWYAPRDVLGPYAEAIARAIDVSSYFVVILSQNSIASQHVLNEIDLAFQNLPEKIQFRPLRIDNTIFTPAFKYYLSRQHWMDATVPPLEKRLNEFVESIVNE